MGQWVYNASPAIDAQSNYPTIVGVSVPLLLLMIFVVCLRLYVRVKMLKRPGPDDWFIIGAAVCSIVYNGLTITQSRYGLGLPLALRPKVNLNTYSTVNFAGRPFYMMGILGFKIALCLGYLRILSRGQRVYRLAVWIVLGACVLGHLAGTLVLILNCNPVKRSWRPLTPGTCLAFGPTNYGLASTTIAFDVLIFFLPIPFLTSLQINSRKKYALIGVFMLGLFTTVCSIMRMTQIPVIATGNGNSTMLVLWGNIEMNVGIILTCIPVLAPLFKFFSQKFSSKGYNSKGEYGNMDSGHTHQLQVFSKNGTPSQVTNPRSSKYPEKETRLSTSNESQETILGFKRTNTSEKALEKGGIFKGEILKTTEVEIKSVKKDGREEMGQTFLDP